MNQQERRSMAQRIQRGLESAPSGRIQEAVEGIAGNGASF